MSPWHPTHSLAERYDLGLSYMRDDQLSSYVARPLPTQHWPKENIEFLERYRDWLRSGGVSELVISIHHVMMAGHVFGLTLKPYPELDPDRDLDCALEYVQAKNLSAPWTRKCRNSLKHFRRFLRLERGLGDESRVTPFDVAAHTQGLPGWLVDGLDQYQKSQQRNWRSARIDQNLRGFWSKHVCIWRFLCEERGVKELGDLKRQFMLDYVDMRLKAGRKVKGVNCELQIFRTFLLFLQDEGVIIPRSLLSIPGLNVPDSLPKHLTDEQVRKLRDELDRGVREAKLLSHRRTALLERATFYLLWQGGMRLGEVEELRLEDLDLSEKRLFVRDSKERQDRTVYLAESAIQAVQEYLAVRGEGSSDHVFLYRNALVKKDLIRSRLKEAGTRVGVRVYPHRLRHTCATQLLNAGCRVTSIQRFLGHKELSSTMIYARAYDQTVAEDYFAAMERVEQRLDIVPGDKKNIDEVVKVQKELSQIIAQLEKPDLCRDERLSIARQLRETLYVIRQHPLKLKDCFPEPALGKEFTEPP